MNTCKEFANRFGLDELWINGERVADDMPLQDLKDLVRRTCVNFRFFEKGKEMCPYCSWRGYPKSPVFNVPCYNDYWLELNSLQQLVVIELFKKAD